jgi:hypothetical protein
MHLDSDGPSMDDESDEERCKEFYGELNRIAFRRQVFRQVMEVD